MHLSFSPDAPAMPEISFDDFLAVDIRIGTVIEAAPLEGARKPSIRMQIDFGDVIGIRKSSAQITEHYAPDMLLGRQVMGVVNFPPRQIGKFMSEVLTLGFADEGGSIRLVGPDDLIPNGTRMS
ncbi:MAG: tRNA-binding protein [Henriciella sp.]|nr:tRNA-binding protein [Henriciella sp.]